MLLGLFQEKRDNQAREQRQKVSRTMGFFGWGKKDDDTQGVSVYEPETWNESTEDDESAALEDFEPFTCRKCGQVVTNPFELCSQHGW